jgi:urease accessory protein
VTRSSPAPWLLLQLADAAFPSGGFAHSLGMEAAAQLGRRCDVEAFLEEALWQVGRGALPFVRAACAAPERLADVDDACDATLVSHTGNRASRAQGRAFASAASRAFGAEVAMVTAHVQVARGPAHLPPVFGAACGALGLSAREAQIAHLHGALRSVLSAAVRLGLLGPLEAQAIQGERRALLDRILATCGELAVEDAAQPSPLVELYGALHDRLEARLFQS